MCGRLQASGCAHDHCGHPQMAVGMAQWGKGPAGQAWEPAQNPYHLDKSQAQWYVLRIPTQGARAGGVLGGHWLASLTELVKSGC